PSMLTLYRVGTVKPVPLEDGRTRWYVSVAGGMSDNIRPALYGADYHAALVSRPATAEPVLARVVGKRCESGAIVVHQRRLPPARAEPVLARVVGKQGESGETVVHHGQRPGASRAGGRLAVPATGASGRSMASQYNLLPRPGVVAVAADGAREIVRRETIEAIL